MLTILLQVRTGRTAAGSHDDTTSPFHLRTLVLIEETANVSVASCAMGVRDSLCPLQPHLSLRHRTTHCRRSAILTALSGCRRTFVCDLGAPGCSTEPVQPSGWVFPIGAVGDVPAAGVGVRPLSGYAAAAASWARRVGL